jgi:DMSO/TMAO reductase YedYZ molybdopterin-dependent catalytic subunit
MNVQAEIARKTRRSFLVGGLAAAAGYAGYRWIGGSEPVMGAAGVLRRNLEWNEKVARAYGTGRPAPEFPVSEARMPKLNGDIGLSNDFDASQWKLQLVTGEKRSVTMDDIRSLPRVDSVTELKCIEGWSQVCKWTGARLSDFAAKFAQGGQTRYVSMATPDEEYFVGLDIESAMHPQTLLCYEMNGKPLTEGHGAPLRLTIPVKYGIKNIKRIGTIAFTNERPQDYWANEGYDWYAGL